MTSKFELLHGIQWDACVNGEQKEWLMGRGMHPIKGEVLKGEVRDAGTVGEGLWVGSGGVGVDGGAGVQEETGSGCGAACGSHGAQVCDAGFSG